MSRFSVASAKTSYSSKFSSSQITKKRDQDVDAWLDQELQKAQSSSKSHPNGTASSHPLELEKQRQSEAPRASSRGPLRPPMPPQVSESVYNSNGGMPSEDEQIVSHRQHMLQRRAQGESRGSGSDASPPPPPPPLVPQPPKSKMHKNSAREREWTDERAQRVATVERQRKELGSLSEQQQQASVEGLPSARKQRIPPGQDQDLLARSIPVPLPLPPPSDPYVNQQYPLSARPTPPTDTDRGAHRSDRVMKYGERQRRSHHQPSESSQEVSGGQVPSLPLSLGTAHTSSRSGGASTSPAPPFSTRRQSTAALIPTPPPLKAPPTQKDEDAYEDDFETYEDDFEEIDASELEGDLPSAKSARPFSGKPYTEVHERRFVHPKDIKEARKRSLAAQQKMQRFKQLTALIELESVTFDLFELVPLTEYEMFVRGSVSQRTSQAASQCPAQEDREEVDVQTDPLEHRSASAQCPEDLGLRGLSGCCPLPTAPSSLNGRPAFDSITLSRFLQKSAPIIEALMQENAEQHRSFSTARSDPKFGALSSGVTRLHDTALCTDRPAIDSSFCACAPYLLAVAHGPPEAGGGGGGPPSNLPEPFRSSAGLACVWNINTPSLPFKVLVCEGPLRSICFSHDRPHLVFAGTSDGSVQLWDLREPDSAHISVATIGGKGGGSTPPSTDSWNFYLIGGRNEVARFPTYSTDWMGDQNHCAPIVRISQMGHSSDALQLVTLDESGLVLFWAAIELQSAPDVSDADFGLSVGARVKLIKTGSLDVSHHRPSIPLSVASSHLNAFRARCFDLQCSPLDPTMLYIGTDCGRVSQLSRFNQTLPPRTYRCGTSPHPSLSPSHCSSSSSHHHHQLLSMHWPALEAGLKANGLLPQAFSASLFEKDGIACGNRTLELTFPDSGSLQRAHSFVAQNFHEITCNARASDCVLVLSVAKSELDSPCFVNSLSVSPFLPKYFIAGASDGSISLFEESRTEPLMSFEVNGRGGVRSVQWSTTRPSVFFVLDSLSTLFVFDLLSPQMEHQRWPLFEMDLRRTRAGSEKSSDAIGFSLSSCKGGLLSPLLCVQYSAGFMEVHSLSPSLSSQVGSEEETVARVLANTHA